MTLPSSPLSNLLSANLPDLTGRDYVHLILFALVALLGHWATSPTAGVQVRWAGHEMLALLGLGAGSEGQEKAGKRKEGKEGREGKEGKGRVVRSRAEQLKLLGREAELSAGPAPPAKEDSGYYPGLVNISGTYCFMNSVLQALASLTYLQPFLLTLHSHAEALDVPTPITDSLLPLLTHLNTPVPAFRSIRPDALIRALGESSRETRSTLFASREHQDAQELFQLVSSALADEARAVALESQLDTGLRSVPIPSNPSNTSAEAGPSNSPPPLTTPFEGLSANRRTCSDCGYTESIFHFPFDNITLPLPPPRTSGSCALEDCLEEYERVERLGDCVCRRCSLVATARKLSAEAARLSASEAGKGEEGAKGASASRKKRAREARRLEARVREALESGRIEEDLKGVKLERVYSSSSSKQVMIARPPPILALHINRSIHFGAGYAGRNPTHVHFPELLPLTPYTTSGELNLAPGQSLSSPSSELSLRHAVQNARQQPVMYRLQAVVCHYGTHSYGHYVAFRRKPPPPSWGEERWRPPRLQCPLNCLCDACRLSGPVRDVPPPGAQPARNRGPRAAGGGGWLRISDDAVEEVGLSAVLREGAGIFMLFYERVCPVFPAEVLGGIPRGVRPCARVLRSAEVRPRRLEQGAELKMEGKVDGEREKDTGTTSDESSVPDAEHDAEVDGEGDGSTRGSGSTAPTTPTEDPVVLPKSGQGEAKRVDEFERARTLVAQQ